MNGATGHNGPGVDSRGSRGSYQKVLNTDGGADLGSLWGAGALEQVEQTPMSNGTGLASHDSISKLRFTDPPSAGASPQAPRHTASSKFLMSMDRDTAAKTASFRKSPSGNGNRHGQTMDSESAKTMQRVLSRKPPDLKKFVQEEETNEVDNFTDEEWDALANNFDYMDLDGDGYISIDEFAAMAKTVGLNENRAYQLANIYDRDGDGLIDFDEFCERNLEEDMVVMLDQSRQIGADGEVEDGKSHVNVTKILQVTRAKIDNSTIAFAFGRYLFFIIIYLFVVLSQRNPEQSLRMSAAVENYFVQTRHLSRSGLEMKGWMDINSVEAIWDWHQILFTDLFYTDKYYNDAFRKKIDRNTIMESIKLTSGFRMTQRRIQNNTCSENKKYKVFAPNCFGEIYDGMHPSWYREREPFIGPVSGNVYRYEEKFPWDVGYYEYFDENKTKTIEHMVALRADNWIGPSTQWYRLDFVVYAPNVGMFAHCAFTTQIRPSGMVIPAFIVTARRYNYYQTGEDWIRLACEVIVIVGWLFYVYGEFQDARRLYKQSGKMLAYFSEFWNAVDMIHLLVILILIGTWIAIISDRTISDIVISEDSITMPDGEPLDFTDSANSIRFYFAANGFNMLIAVIRILKFLRQNAFLGQLTDAFELMRPGLVQFCVVLFIVIFMFTSMAVILFGSKINEFTTFLDSVDQVMGYTVGYAEPLELFQVNKVGSILFYYPFTFLMAFFVLPLTVAVIMDGYGEMQVLYEQARETNLHDVITLPYGTQLYRGFIRSIQFFIPNHKEHPRLKYPSKQETLKLFADLKDYDVISYAELLKMFKDKMITKEELNEIIEKYNAFQPDPEWHHLSDAKALKAREDEEAEEDSKSFMPLIQTLQLRADQLVRDQAAMMRKLDLLCEIFPPPAPVVELSKH